MWEVKEHADEYLVQFDMLGMTREDVREGSDAVGGH
jgi:hypothetical protein